MFKIAVWVVADYVMLALVFHTSVMFPKDGLGDLNLLINTLGIPVPIMIFAAVLGIYRTPLGDVLPVMWKFMVATAAGFVVWSPMLDIYRPENLKMMDIAVFFIAGYGVMLNTRYIIGQTMKWLERRGASA